MKAVNLGIAVSIIILIVGINVPARGDTTTIFADGFDGSQLSSVWTLSTFQTDQTSPATATLSNSLLTLASTGPSTNGLDLTVPFVPTGNNLTVTARVRADAFGRFHVGLLTQPGTFDQNSVAAAFEFDLTGTLSTDCGNKGGAIDRIGAAYSVFRCNTSTGTWYRFQIVATDNPYTVTWNYMDDTGALISTTSQTSTAYSFSSIKYLSLQVWAAPSDSLYDVDWIAASSPSPPPSHAGSSGSTPVIVNSRTTSTTVNCSPASVMAGQSTTCMATVTDVAAGTASTPTGSVGWTSSGRGSFDHTTCTLSGTGASASCSVNYTPEASGSQVVTANYGGDSVQPSSTQPVTLVVSNKSGLDSLMIAGLIGGTGAIGIAIGVAVTLLTKRRKLSVSSV